jgi:DNA polymerase-3 subunit alpha
MTNIVPFVSTHTHTVFSVGDGKSSIKELFEYVKEQNMPGIFITDHGNICHIPEAIMMSKKLGVNYAPGCELYFSPSDRKDPLNGHSYHLLVYPISQKGYHNFVKLVSDAGVNKTSVKRTDGKTSRKEYERTDLKTLKKYGEGLAGTSACIGGWIPSLIREGKIKEAKKAILLMKKVFDLFYLEVQCHEQKDQILVNEHLKKLSKETNTPLIMAFDSHYIKAKDKRAHDVLSMIDYRKPNDYELHMRTYKEVIAYCKKYKIPKEAITNTYELFKKASNLKLKPDDTNFFIPSYEVPKGYSEDSYLIKIAKEGIIEKAKKKRLQRAPSEYFNQIDYEINQVISPKGFSGYFLILWDLFKEAKKRKVLMGPGRGSAAGSTVSYAINVTKLDPIENDFIFERFLTRQRDEFPDIDSDISKDKRSEMIDYLSNRYGKKRVAQLITFTYIKLKNAIKGAMRALDTEDNPHPYEEANKLTKGLPSQIEGKDATITLYKEIIYEKPDKWLNTLGDKEYAKIKNQWDRIEKFFSKYPDVQEVIEDLAGCIINTGVHAGAVIVSDKDLSRHVPITSAKKGSSAVLPLVAFDMSGAAFFNLLKIDLLGLKTLSYLEEFMDITGLDYEWYESEEFDDPKVYETINKKFTADGFQISTPSAKALLNKFKIETFQDFIAFVAGNRPGPLAKNPDTGESMMDKYLKAKSTGVIEKIHKDVDPLLAKTYGCIW